MSRADAGVRRPGLTALALLAAVLTAGGCRQDMQDQPRYEPLEASTFFDDGRASREPVAGTVPRGGLREDEHLYTGLVNGQPAETLPFPATMEVLERGRQRYNIFCSPCHDALGTGRGMVVRRGFPPAASFHDERLRDQKVGYFFDVMTRGFGRMQGYAAQIPVHDRWAIVAYVRALQMSRSATLDDVPEPERDELVAEREGR